MSGGVIESRQLLALRAYWDGKRRGRPMPVRNDIDALDMDPQLLPHVVLFERASALKLRLVGTKVVARWGFDPTGRELGPAIGPGYFAYLARLHLLALHEQAPVYGLGLFRWDRRHWLEARHLVLPLAHADGEPRLALTGIVFQSEAAFPPSIQALEAIGVMEECGTVVLDDAASREAAVA